MRGLNLSALASRGRAAEAIHSARVQAQQASELRSKLSAEELASLRASAVSDPTVDVLGSISGQSAIARLAVESARATRSTSASVGRAGNVPSILSVRSKAVALSTTAEEPVMRALGANKFGLYQRIAARQTPGRPLPGSDKYAEGAVVGMASFSVATAIVGGIGMVGIGVLYLNPAIVEEMRFATRRFRGRLETGLGDRLKAFSERMRREDSIISKESREKAQRLARSAIKLHSVEEGTRKSDSDEKS